jgi:hypothetical protein|tara:strand:- start:1412 stop:2098 length:687 start_codon:yes stop_codon:yes gene_type:complete
MIVLDLFSGTKSLKPVCDQLGYEYISLDIDRSTDPDICCNLLDWDYKEWNKSPDIIWASPECKWYSKLTTSSNKYSKEEIEEGMIGGDKLVKRVFEIIQYFNPEKWFIENPFTGRLKNRDVMKGYHFYRTDYCQWSDWGYKKPTCIWTNIEWTECRRCNPRTCPFVFIDYSRPNKSPNLGYYYNHKCNLGGVKTELTRYHTTKGAKIQRDLKYRIPEKLILSLLYECE